MEWEILDDKEKLDEINNNILELNKHITKLKDNVTDLTQIVKNQQDMIQLLLQYQENIETSKNTSEETSEEIGEDNSKPKPMTPIKPILRTFPIKPIEIKMPVDLDHNYINRITNRMWRNSSYVTTPNSFFNILNRSK